MRRKFKVIWIETVQKAACIEADSHDKAMELIATGNLTFSDYLASPLDQHKPDISRLFAQEYKVDRNGLRTIGPLVKKRGSKGA